MKKSSSRSQRGSKGIKGKHILQICVLLGVCIWLIYQVKYSHDKKKEFYEKDEKKSTILLSENEDGLVKLGRKDLVPKKEEEKHVEEDEDEEEIRHGEEEEEEKEKKSKVEVDEEEEKEEEEEEVVEEDEEDKNKQGEEVVEEDEEENKHEEDEIDEQDQSKTVEETDKEDELLAEEKEGRSNEKEKETNHADEIDMTVDEAREEHYKADDASSAVSHESRVLKTEKLKESSGNSTETGQENDPKVQTEPVLKLGEAESGDFVNKTATEVKDGESESSSSEAKSVVTELRGQENTSNANTSEVKIQKEPVLKLREAESGDSVDKTASEVKHVDRESSNSETESAVTELRGETINGNSTEPILEASGFLHNETEIMRERSQEHNKTEAGASPPGSSDLLTVFKPNETDHNKNVAANITSKGSVQDEFKNSTSESSLTENISGQNATKLQENSRSEGDYETDEKESSDLFSTEQMEEADDTSESTILQEEREALTDTQTLPDIKVEGNEEEDEITAE